MSTFLAVGLAHHGTPLPQLERVAAGASARAELQAAALAAGCAEVLVLSTCSRTELHVVLAHPGDTDAGSEDAARDVAELLGKALVGHLAEPVGPLHVAVGEQAVRHLFRVAAGLDSRIFGEVEVQAQLRAAVRVAAAQQGEPHRLRRVVAAGVASARQVALFQPGLLRRGLLAERAAARALDVVGRVPGVEAVVVGAGTMGRQVVAALRGHGCRATLLSRTTSARAGGPPVHRLTELPGRLATADVVFVATSAGRRLLSVELMADVLATRPGRPLTVVDLSLPRNVDPAVAGMRGVRLLDLDDLADVACGSAPDPRGVAAVEAAIRDAADAYCAEIRSRRAGPVITALRSRMESTCLEQLRRTTRGLGLAEAELSRMASAVAGALAHSPAVLARESAADDDHATLAVLAAVFRLHDPV